MRTATLESPSTQVAAKGTAVEQTDRGPVILVIDDDPDVREVFQRQLEALGARVVVAADGFEGLDQLERSNPDAVLCDLAMPGMDGIEFGIRMRADMRFCRVRLIAVTGRCNKAALLGSWGAGFDGHIDKPVTAEMLASIVTRFTGRVLGNNRPPSVPG